MDKGKFTLLMPLALGLLCWHFLPMHTDAAKGPQAVDQEKSDAMFFQPGTRCWFICPQGDGDRLDAGNNEILTIIKNSSGDPIVGMPKTDYWLIGWTDNFCMSNGTASIDADADSDAQGYASISGTMAAGGWELASGVGVVVQGVWLGLPPISLPMHVMSPDIDCDLDVDLVDFAVFAEKFASTSGDPNYDHRCDYDCDGDVDLIDFSRFAQHWMHSA